MKQGLAEDLIDDIITILHDKKFRNNICFIFIGETMGIKNLCSHNSNLPNRS